MRTPNDRTVPPAPRGCFALLMWFDGYWSVIGIRIFYCPFRIDIIAPGGAFAVRCKGLPRERESESEVCAV